MRYAAIKANDVVDCSEGICVSFWTQGCPHHCKNCHNPDQWTFNGGIEASISSIEEEIVRDINNYNIHRDFSVLGGEPLCPENASDVLNIILYVKEKCPHSKIYAWTGYTYEQLIQMKDVIITSILSNIDVLIDGPYIEEKRDITLPLRGSTNQRILYKGKDF